GTVGRLEERKGHAHFLDAARTLVARANGVAPQLLVVGDGPLRETLVRQAGSLGLAESVRFTGALADVRVPLAAMDVFVLPAHAPWWRAWRRSTWTASRRRRHERAAPRGALRLPRSRDGDAVARRATEPSPVRAARGGLPRLSARRARDRAPHGARRAGARRA